MNLRDEHEQAERVAEELGISLENGLAKYHGRRVTPQAIRNAYADAWGRNFARHELYIEPETLVRLLQDILDAEEELARAQAENSGNYFPNVMEWVREHYGRLQIEISDSGVWSYVKDGQRIDYSLGNFANYLKTILPEYNNQVPKDLGFPTFKSDTIIPAIHTFLVNRETRKVSELRNLLAWRENDVNPEEFVRGLLAIYWIPQTPENIAAFMHLIWMIKRNVWMLPIPEPLFFAFHSVKQHLGKTTLLRKLCTGFEWAHSDRGILTHLLDINQYKAMVRGKYLLDFQELALGHIRGKHGGVDEATVVALKSIITSDTISGREMYMTANGVERQTAVFASSTNKNIWDVISDPSGMRRYWQFNLLAPEEYDHEFYLAANVYYENILDLYHSIDENNPIGYFHPSLPLWNQMRRVQDGYARENAFLAYAHQIGWEFVPDDSDGAVKMEIKHIVEKFNNYLRGRGDPTWSAKYVTWAIASNRDISPTVEVVPGGKLKEFYWVKSITRGN